MISLRAHHDGDSEHDTKDHTVASRNTMRTANDDHDLFLQERVDKNERGTLTKTTSSIRLAVSSAISAVMLTLVI